MWEFFTVFLVGERHQKMESDIINMVCLVDRDSSSSSLARPKQLSVTTLLQE
jgi:hypothetical protein